MSRSALCLVSAAPLPEVLYEAQTTRYEDSFLLTGGYGDITTTDTIYKFDAASEDFILMETRLPTPRNVHVAMMVESSKFNACY